MQRVSKASVDVLDAEQSPRKVARIGAGLLLLVAVGFDDSLEDVEWLVSKIVNMRIFEDTEGKMNLSILQTAGEVLVVSQFTLLGSMKKGNRPSFNRSAPPEISKPLFEKFCGVLTEKLGKKIPTGEFGAMMNVHLCNDGPVTIILDSKNRDI